MMSENPYQSPAILSGDEAGEGDFLLRRLKWALAGLFFGGFLGGGVGAAGAGLFGLLMGIALAALRPFLSGDDWMLFPFVLAIVGAFAGAAAGATIGGVGGFVAPGMKTPELAARFEQVVAVIGGLAGGLLGVIGGLIPMMEMGPIWLGIGGVMGAGSGALGGWVFARNLVRRIQRRERLAANRAALEEWAQNLPRAASLAAETDLPAAPPGQAAPPADRQRPSPEADRAAT